MTPNQSSKPARMKPMPRLIFASRWLQLPLYLGLIAAQGVYVFHFWVELVHLLEAVFGSQLLKTFINAANYDVKVLMWQTIIHATFLLSALAIAATDRLMAPSHGPAH
jgi:uncharacterized membrane protein YqhA